MLRIQVLTVLTLAFISAYLWLASTPAWAQTPRTPSPTPGWVRDAVIYQVFVRAFTEEGTIRALTEQVPAIADLGVDTVYLMPIHPIGREARLGSLGSPYSIQDYYAIDPALGTKEDFRAFVNTAHAHGLRVIMDLVINHTSHDNPLRHTHPEWYQRAPDGTVKHPENWQDVLQLDFGNAELRAYLIDMATYWVREFDIDGFRADASYLIPIDFWWQFQEELRHVKPDLLLLSESDTPELFGPFDIAYNWPIGHRIQDVARGSVLPTQLLQWSQWQLYMNYLENHDHPRIAGLVGARSTKPFAAFLLTIPGVPLIQNGQEIGAIERIPLFDPGSIDWELADRDLRDYYRKLIQIRRDISELRTGSLRTVRNNVPGVVLTYQRVGSQGRTLVLINFSDNTHEVTIQLAGLDPARQHVDLLTGEPVSFRIESGQATTTLAPSQAVVVRIT